MRHHEMVALYQSKTGRPAWIGRHPAGPSLCASSEDGTVHGVVIPIDLESRARVVEALIHYTQKAET